MLVPVYKPLYATPLDCVRAYRAKYNLPVSEVVSYCGRLDPMASGVQMLLIGAEANQKRRVLEHMPKAYVTQIAFGLQTDSLDMLGMYLQSREVAVTKDQIEHILPKFHGTFEQTYPAFSSAKVHGKPLYYYAHRGLLDTVKIPTHMVTVSEINIMSESTVSTGQILQQVRDACANVKGNFRQSAILKSFDDGLSEVGEFVVFEFEIRCGGGFYVRQFASDLGAAHGVPATVLAIHRTQVGEYGVGVCERVFV